MNQRFRVTAFAMLIASFASPLLAQEVAPQTEPQTTTLELANGALVVTTPVAWKQIKPRYRIIEAELSIPPVETEADDEAVDRTPGRLTVTSASGGVQANLDRWVGQFRNLAAEPKIEKSEVAGMQLSVLDIAGTFLSSPRGPFGPKVEKPDQRMLAAILETGGHGNYFFKFVGPAPLVKEHAEAFQQMLASATKPGADAE